MFCGASSIFSWKINSVHVLSILIFSILAPVFPLGVFVMVNGSSNYNVAIVSYHFQPQTINITTGTNVVWTFWTNGTDSGDVHTVTSDNITQSGAGIFQSQLMHSGQTFAFTFYSPGNYPYHCSVHPTMKAVVTVTGTPVSPPSGATDYLVLYVGLTAAIAAAIVVGGIVLFRRNRRKSRAPLQFVRTCSNSPRAAIGPSMPAYVGLVLSPLSIEFQIDIASEM
jgi:plastocyanin